MTRTRYDHSASEDMNAAGKEFTSGAQTDQDNVETGSRQISANLNGAGSEEAAMVQRQAFERSDAMTQASIKANQTDERTTDTNLAAMPRMKSLFGNNG
jgi:hypothetical protein